MNILINIYLFVTALAFAYLALTIFNFIQNKIEQYKVWYELYYNNYDLKKFKINKLKESSYDYHLTRIINTPEVVANELAVSHMNKIIKTGRVNELYSKLKECC